MADPFEVRMRFTNLLHHLNASTTGAHKAAHYALKHAEFSDDLHSCILEQLERNGMNNRANIMYFLPSLCEAAREKGEVSYGRMMERDILRIVDAVAPDDGSGAANVKVVRRVLRTLEGKGFLQGQTVLELEECIVGRDQTDGLVSSPPHPAIAAPDAPPKQDAGGGGGGGAVLPSTIRSTPHSTVRDSYTAAAHHIAAPPPVRLDKRQVEQRIEEDRERHKRAREGIWAVRQEGSGLKEDAEFERGWDEESGVEGEDGVMAREDVEEKMVALRYEEAV